MRESIRRALEGAKHGVMGLFESAKGMRVSRQALARIGWYASLALLLAALGSASCAYRARVAADGERDMPKAAAALRVPEPTPAPEATQPPVQWVWPLEGEVVGAYSPDEPVWSEALGQWQTHPALDIAGSPGEAVYACRDGEVSDAWSDRLWGNVIVLAHADGYRSTYAGLNTLKLVEPGDAVRAGQVIGSVGQSAAGEAELGWHLHFELTKDGEPVDFEAMAMPR